MSARKSKKKLKKAKARRYHVSTLAHTVIRLPRPRVEIDRGKHWYCVWTALKCERRVDKSLRAAGFTTYLPIETRRVVKRGKPEDIESLPVGRYLFVGLTAHSPEFGKVGDVLRVERETEERLEFFYRGERYVVETPSPKEKPIGELLTNNGAPVRIPARDMQALADFLTAQDRQLGTRRNFLFGQQVKPVGGPFFGIPGTVDETTDDRVRVLLNLLGRATPVEFASHELEAA